MFCKQLLRSLKFAALSGLILLLGFANQSTGAPELSLDPFEQPAFLNKKSLKSGKKPSGNGETFNPRLRGTMRSAAGSIANINGEIVRVGEEYEGFRLLRVTHRSAELERFGVKFVITMEGGGKDEVQ